MFLILHLKCKKKVAAHTCVFRTQLKRESTTSRSRVTVLRTCGTFYKLSVCIRPARSHPVGTIFQQHFLALCACHMLVIHAVFYTVRSLGYCEQRPSALPLQLTEDPDGGWHFLARRFFLVFCVFFFFFWKMNAEFHKMCFRIYILFFLFDQLLQLSKCWAILVFPQWAALVTMYSSFNGLWNSSGQYFI